MKTSRLVAAVLAVALHAAATAADAPAADVPGAGDHPLIKRFAGSWLAGQRVSNWDAAVLPGSAELSKADARQFKEPLNLEGKVTQTLYIAPRGKAALEVWRNYEQASTPPASRSASPASATAPISTSPGGRPASPTRA